MRTKRKTKNPFFKKKTRVDPLLKPYYFNKKNLRFQNVEFDPEDECVHRMLLDVDWPKNETSLPESLKRRLKNDKTRHPIELEGSIFSFNDNRVRERMIRLMNTDVVRLMDREFMKELQEKIVEAHKEELKKRLKDRAENEFLRELDLVIHGVLPKENAVKNVKKIFAFMNDKTDDHSAEEHSTSKVTGKPATVIKPPDVDYSPFMTKEEINPQSSNTDIASIQSELTSEDELEKLRKDFTNEVQDEIERMYIQPVTYERVRYETDDIKELRKAKDVESMYELAEKIFYQL